MTDSETIIEIAKLDGWEYFPDGHNYHCATPEHHKWFNTEDGCCYSDPRRYLTSLDAIVPVIEKQHFSTRLKFREALWELLDQRMTVCANHLVQDQAELFLFAQPKELCIALLKSIGAWKEE